MKNQSLYITMFISLFLFIVLGIVVQTANGMIYDERIISWTQELSNSALDQTMSIFSLLGSSEVILVLTVLIGAIFLLKRNWYHFIFFAAVSVGGVVLNFALKMIFQRERPGGEISYIEVFAQTFEIPSYSFPSGHTMRSTILLLFILYLLLKYVRNRALKVGLSLVLFFLILMVAISRIFLEAHYLSDIIGGVTISVTWFLALYLWIRKYDPSNQQKLFLDRYRY